MTEISFYVRLKIPDSVLSDKERADTAYYIKDCIQDLAEGLQGSIVDLEIK